MDTNVDRLVKYASFGDTLSSALNDESFYSIPVNERGNYVAGLIEGFSKINNLNEDDKDYIGKLAEEQLTDFRISNNIPRFVPTQEQAAELFDRFPDTSTDERVEDVERKVDAWKASSLAKASALRPAEREDIETYLNRSSNNFIREEAARLNDTGWFMDKGYRAVEELAKPFHQLLDPDGSDRFWAKSAPENPSYDQDFTSLIAGGIGQVIPQIAISIGLTAAGSPEAIPAVFTALYGAEYMQNGYREEFARSGDEGKAWDNAVSQIPAALLETVGDMVLTKGVTKTARQFGKEFASASTMEAKKAILREALPTMGKAAKEGFIAEAFVGGMAAEWASGYGSYLATGDENYLRSTKDIIKGGLAEGIVGGLTAGLLHGVTNDSTRKAFAQDVSTLTGLKVKQEEIYAALKNGDFQKVIDITNKDIITDPAQQDATLDVVDKARAAINGKPITEEEKAATPKASSLVIPSTTRVKIRQDIENIDKELSDPSVTEERSNELNKRRQYLTDVNEKINNGTYEELNEVKGTVDTTSVYRDHEAIGKNDKGLTTQEITLDNGERFSYTTDDIPVFLQSNTFKQTLNGIVARFGQENVTVDLVATSGNAVIKWTEDGKKKHSQGFPYTRTPRKGFTPLTLNANGTLKIHNPINEIKYAGNARNIEVITDDTVNNIITVKNKKGETITLDGERANTLRASIPNYKPEEVAKEKAEDTKPKEKKASVVDNSAQEKLTFERGNVPIVADGERRFLHKETNKMGVVVKDNGTLLFKPDDNSTPIELGGAESQITLNDAGLTRELDVRTPTEVDTNDIVDILEHEQIQSEKQSKPTTTVDKKAATKRFNDFINEFKSKFNSNSAQSITQAFNLQKNLLSRLFDLGIEVSVIDSSESIANSHAYHSEGKIYFVADRVNEAYPEGAPVALFELGLIHESAHAGTYLLEKQDPELYISAKENFLQNKELNDLMVAEYPGYETLSEDNKFYEGVRAIIEGRLKGRTTGLAKGGKFAEFLNKLLNYIRNTLFTSRDKIVFQFVSNVEDVLGVTPSVKFANNNITVNGIPSNIVSDFATIVYTKPNSEGISELINSYSRENLRLLAGMMRLNQSGAKQDLIDRIVSYKPVSENPFSDNSIMESRSQTFNNNITEVDREYLAAVMRGDNVSDDLESALKTADATNRQVIVDSWMERNPKTEAELQRMVDEAALPKLENLAKKALSEIYKGKKTRVEVRDGNLVVLTSRQYTIGKGVLTQNLKGNTVSKDTLEASVPLALASFRSFSFLNPVTYDDAGNIIPPSKRFNPQSNNINESQPIIVGSDFFADSGKFYRVIQGDESLNDILQSGEVRTNAAEKIKSGMTLAEKMAARPTAFPSFSKGSASMSYAAENPNHSIIVTADKSLQPSTSGRHSAGKTHFPTVDGVHQKSLGNNFQVYKHIGNGEYELVFDKGMTGEIDNVPFSLATRRSFLKGLASSILLSHQANAGESLNEAMKGVGTNLSPEEEVKFQAWKAKYAPMDSGSDYDLRGAFKEGITPDGERGHFPDTYKFPNHPTFSKESKYSTPEHPGGEWGERNGRTTFTPSEWMADDASRMEDLKKYFKKVEPDAELIMPGSGGKPVGSTNNNIQNSQPITNEENTNEGESKPNENIIDEVVDSEYEHTDTVLGTPISPFRKTQIERLNKLRSVKIEALLSVEDKALFKSIKAIKALAALNDDVLAEYVTLYEDFVSTRSNNIDAGVSRPASSELINKLSSLTEKAKQAWFEEQKDTFPELAQKDFQKDFQGKMDYVNDFISKLSGMEETTGTDKVSKNKEAFLAKIDDLRAVINENYDQMKEDLFSRMDLDFKESDNPHIQKGIELMRARMNDSKEWYGEFLNHLLNVDVIDMSAKNVRNTYYALMSVAYDGYVMNTDGFVSSSINDLLADSEGVVPLNTFTSTAAARVVPNLMSTSTKARSIVSNKGYIALQKIASNFRESLKQSHMMHELVLVPYQKESIDNAQKKSGKRYSDSDLQRIGIYAISRRIRIGFDVKSEIERNISQIKDSILVLSRSGDKKLRRASEWYNKYIDTLFDGVLKSETPIETLESNAVNAGIDDGMKGYVNDIVNFFDAFKPIAKFTKEFIYNREFIDEHNYVPTMILNLDESKGPLQYNTDDVTLNMTPEDTSERNVNTNGMSGTFDRSARLKENQALVFNINHLFSNRGRLNFLDAFSAVRRKEISTLLNAKTQKGQEMRDFLGDEFGGQFRYHTFIDFVKTQWKAEIESVQYIHQYQSVINGALSRWGGFALSSVYQGVMQLTSNIAPFMMANIGNPQKISAMFKAYDYMNRHRAGLLTPQQALIYEKVLFDVAHRHQDQVLDTSVNLGITQDGLWQAFKSSAIANGISKVDKIIDKVKFFQFRTADFLSGAPVMLAEYLDAEQKRLGAEMTFEDLVYDPGSYAIALDETERFIGIGNATRRGEWMTSRDAPITILRHMLTGFAGHRVNNATNFYVEMRKIANENISTEEKLKSASYVAGIISQSVIFSAGKVAIIYFLMSATKGILDGNDSDDDKVEELYRNRANAQTEKEKKLIDAEIAKRKQIRAVWKKAIDRQSDSYLFTMGLSKDIISNIFVSANLFEPIVDKLLYFPIDEHEEKMFKELKAKRTEALESKIKNAKSLGDTGSLVELQRQLADTQASEFLRMTHPSFGNIIPYGGMYGGVSRNLEKVFDASLNPDTLTLNDVSNMAAAFGWNLADVSRITRIMESVDDAKLEAEKKKRRLNGN